MTSKRQGLDALGLAGEDDSYGSTVLSEGELAVPSYVALSGEDVLWEFDSVERRSARGMLGDLLLLRAPTDVLRYVQRFGPINVCREHVIPIGHNPVPENPATDTPSVWQRAAGRPFELPPSDEERQQLDQFCMVDRIPGTWTQREPVNAYLGLAEALNAGLRIATALKQASPLRLTWADLGRDEDWLDFTMGLRGRPLTGASRGREFNPRVAPKIEDLHFARWCFGNQLNLMTAWGRLRPTVVWDLKRGPEFLIEADQFGLLMMQLSHAIAETRAIAACSACGTFHAPKRKPAVGRRNYCPACRDDKIDGRDAQRDRRAGRSKPRRHRADSEAPGAGLNRSRLPGA